MKSSITLSAEVRWFFDGEIPLTIENWFNASKLRAEPEERADTYLIYPNAESCGVKFRDNKFEVKSLVKDLGRQEFAGRAHGVVGLWEKWSTKGGPITQFRRGVTEDATIWIDVKKERVVRKYSADGRSIKEVDASGRDGFPDNGCNAELTRIEIRQKPYWSLAFDSFGEKDSLVDSLVQTARILLSESECPFTRSGERLGGSLSDQTSHSYPSFLALHKIGRKVQNK
jgi:hypothetical protein